MSAVSPRGRTQLLMILLARCQGRRLVASGSGGGGGASEDKHAYCMAWVRSCVGHFVNGRQHSGADGCLPAKWLSIHLSTNLLPPSVPCLPPCPSPSQPVTISKATKQTKMVREKEDQQKGPIPTPHPHTLFSTSASPLRKQFFGPAPSYAYRDRGEVVLKGKTRRLLQSCSGWGAD